MMNIKYFLLFLILNINLSNNFIIAPDTSKTDDNKIEHEKEIEDNQLIQRIQRDVQLYNYTISAGSTVPLGNNIKNNFNSGNSLSIIIQTPYKTPTIINRFDFYASLELSFKSFPSKTDKAPFNVVSTYLILDQTRQRTTLDIKYGIGLSEIFNSKYSALAPSLKVDLEYRVDFYPFYSFLIKKHLVKENVQLTTFLNNLKFCFGVSPNLIFGYPGRKREMLSLIDIYFRLNLFSL